MRDPRIVSQYYLGLDYNHSLLSLNCLCSYLRLLHKFSTHAWNPISFAYSSISLFQFLFSIGSFIPSTPTKHCNNSHDRKKQNINRKKEDIKKTLNLTSSSSIWPLHFSPSKSHLYSFLSHIFFTFYLSWSLESTLVRLHSHLSTETVLVNAIYDTLLNPMVKWHILF